MPEIISYEEVKDQCSKFKDLMPIAPGTQVELDPQIVFVNYASFTGTRLVRIRADGFGLLAGRIPNPPKIFGWIAASPRISFGIAHTSKLLGVMAWIQDHERVPQSDKLSVGSHRM